MLVPRKAPLKVERPWFPFRALRGFCKAQSLVRLIARVVVCLEPMRWEARKKAWKSRPAQERLIVAGGRLLLIVQGVGGGGWGSRV